MKVKDGDELMGDTGGGGYLCWERPPGHTTITGIGENESKVELNAERGRSHYILQRIHMGFWLARNELQIVDEKEGRDYLADCDPPTPRPRPAP